MGTIDVITTFCGLVDAAVTSLSGSSDIFITMPLVEILVGVTYGDLAAAVTK